MRNLVLVLGVLAACGGGSPTDLGDLECDGLEAPVGDAAGEYDLDWHCHAEISDDFPNQPRPCSFDENPLRLVSELVVTADPGALWLDFVGTDEPIGASVSADGVTVSQGVDGDQQRTGGYVSRCTRDSLVIGIGWRTHDGQATTYWYAMAHRR
jgi:hypothetical protein